MFYLQVWQFQEPLYNNYKIARTSLHIQKIISFGANKGSDFDELWHQDKKLETMEINKTLPDILDKGYIHQLQPGPTHKTQQQQQ